METRRDSTRPATGSAGGPRALAGALARKESRLDGIDGELSRGGGWDRRRILMLVAGLGAGLLSMGHSPYRQWYVYRRVRLFILTSAADPESYPLGELVAAFLLSHLPETRAMAARARDSVEIVKLLASEQLDVALLTPADARATLGGEDPFGAYGPVQLRALASLGSHLMVCRNDYPAANAYQIAKTLAEHWRRPAPALLAGSAPADPAGSLPASEETDPPFPIPMHPGASEYHEGRQRNR